MSLFSNSKNRPASSILSASSVALSGTDGRMSRARCGSRIIDDLRLILFASDIRPDSEAATDARPSCDGLNDAARDLMQDVIDTRWGLTSSMSSATSASAPRLCLE